MNSLWASIVLGEWFADFQIKLWTEQTFNWSEMELMPQKCKRLSCLNWSTENLPARSQDRRKSNSLCQQSINIVIFHVKVPANVSRLILLI